MRTIWIPTLHSTGNTSAPAFLAGQSRVRHLLLACRPAHVARLVVAIVLDAIQRQVGRWTPTDVSQKRFETVTPLFAYGDATASVVAILGVVGVVAALQHRSPQNMLSASAQAMRPALILASAGFRHSGAETPNKHFALFATATSASDVTHPLAAVDAVRLTENNPVPDRRSCGDVSAQIQYDSLLLCCRHNDQFPLIGDSYV